LHKVKKEMNEKMAVIIMLAVLVIALSLSIVSILGSIP